jgi:hypothetical protein
MNEWLRFVPSSVDFDPGLASELARREATNLSVDEASHQIVGRCSPFDGYLRALTPEGGILILYKDQKRNLFLTCLRVFAWVTATSIGGWSIFFDSSLSILECLVAFVLLMLVSGFVVCWRIEVSHSVEIRPDAMIVDDKEVFYAEDIGDNWPELQMKDDDPDRMVICGTCGTRHIEYMTANRLSKNDRTPEVLADDLKAAMEQLWGRRELTFPTDN